MAITVDAEALCCALESTGDCFVNLKTGEVVHIPMEFEDFDGFCAERRALIKANRKTFKKVDPFPTNMAFEIREEFANNLPDTEPAKRHLLEALRRNRPFRRFKDVLDQFLDVRQQWFAFRDREMDYWGAWWLRKNSIDAEVVRSDKLRLR